MSTFLEAVQKPTIVTAIAARLNFQSGPVYVWTGVGSITAPSNTSDEVLDGQTFDALAHEMIEIGENTYTMQGSNELVVTLNVPSAPSIQLAASAVSPSEYQGRSAVLWRAMMVPATNPLNAPVWLFQRIRSGTMDKVEIQADGSSHKFMLTIESHGGKISNASNQTYLNQRSYDPNDSSQDYAPAIANGDPAPTASVVSGGSYGGGGGYRGGEFGNNVVMD